MNSTGPFASQQGAQGAQGAQGGTGPGYRPDGPWSERGVPEIPALGFDLGNILSPGPSGAPPWSGAPGTPLPTPHPPGQPRAERPTKFRRVPFAWRLLQKVPGFEPQSSQSGGGGNWTAGNINRTHRTEKKGG